jgi:ribonuclease HII
MLKNYARENNLTYVVGLDEVGRGSFAGPVVTGAVILPPDFESELIKDSKLLKSKKKKQEAFDLIIENAIAYSVQAGSVKQINKYGINPATFIGMHKCLDDLPITPEHILVDGNQWEDYNGMEYTCVEKGDNTYLSIAAAAILAKVKRDEYMIKLHEHYPNYGWDSNKGYHSKIHAEGLKIHGVTNYHRTKYVKNFI